ncbi:MAG: hypothetical protein FJW34_00120 [Acidobacteria bacterium]|nr:hypothetical protein [Acidobacteriota bacterium]
MKQEPLKVATSAELIDELGAIQQALAPLKALEKRAGAIRETIVGWMARRKPEATGTFEGKRWVAVVGPQQNQRTIKNLEKLFDRLGKKRFLDLCSVRLMALEDEIPLAERGEFIEEALRGPRKLELAPLGRRPK